MGEAVSTSPRSGGLAARDGLSPLPRPLPLPLLDLGLHSYYHNKLIKHQMPPRMLEQLLLTLVSQLPKTLASWQHHHRKLLLREQLGRDSSNLDLFPPRQSLFLGGQSSLNSHNSPKQHHDSLQQQQHRKRHRKALPGSVPALAPRRSGRRRNWANRKDHGRPGQHHQPRRHHRRTNRTPHLILRSRSQLSRSTSFDRRRLLLPRPRPLRQGRREPAPSLQLPRRLVPRRPFLSRVGLAPNGRRSRLLPPRDPSPRSQRARHMNLLARRPATRRYYPTHQSPCQRRIHPRARLLVHQGREEDLHERRKEVAGQAPRHPSVGREGACRLSHRPTSFPWIIP